MKTFQFQAAFNYFERFFSQTKRFQMSILLQYRYAFWNGVAGRRFSDLRPGKTFSLGSNIVYAPISECGAFRVNFQISKIYVSNTEIKNWKISHPTFLKNGVNCLKY